MNSALTRLGAEVAQVLSNAVEPLSRLTAVCLVGALSVDEPRGSLVTGSALLVCICVAVEAAGRVLGLAARQQRAFGPAPRSGGAR